VAVSGLPCGCRGPAGHADTFGEIVVVTSSVWLDGSWKYFATQNG